jgi:hypothetical protein
MTSDDPYDLDRFVRAQERAYAQALAEVRAGRKQSHWMWFVFPQWHVQRSSRAFRRRARCSTGCSIDTSMASQTNGPSGSSTAHENHSDDEGKTESGVRLSG